jgi:hypothetical protein
VGSCWAEMGLVNRRKQKYSIVQSRQRKNRKHGWILLVLTFNPFIISTRIANFDCCAKG